MFSGRAKHIPWLEVKVRDRLLHSCGVMVNGYHLARHIQHTYREHADLDIPETTPQKPRNLESKMTLPLAFLFAVGVTAKQDLSLSSTPMCDEYVTLSLSQDFPNDIERSPRARDVETSSLGQCNRLHHPVPTSFGGGDHWVCSQCGMAFAKQDSFNRHMRTVHAG